MEEIDFLKRKIKEGRCPFCGKGRLYKIDKISDGGELLIFTCGHKLKWIKEKIHININKLRRKVEDASFKKYKRPREINNARFFVDWFNKKNSLDFCISDDREESSAIDVLIKSEKLKKEINIQNVAYRKYGTFHKRGFCDVPGLKVTSILGKVMSDEEKKKTIIKCIEEKEKKYPELIIKNLLLLIEVTIPSLSPEEIKNLFPDGINSNFKGIYFVKLPVLAPSRDDKYDQEGYVFPLKEFKI
ncbi:MAG: hypothetical protein PHI88_01550 [Candidatus Pacebacteria bacterium]|nr:hypothetical protein [Candidatus Paceibacterota bacterium]